MEFEIFEVTDASASQLVSEVARLIAQLSSAPAPTQADLVAIAGSEATTLLAARVKDSRVQASDASTPAGLAGCLVLVMFRIPTGLRARIEDVVVDETYRGFGIGRALNQAALKRAAAAGARSVDLTSSPSREAANQLYLSLGFEKRQTNVYRYSL